MALRLILRLVVYGLDVAAHGAALILLPRIFFGFNWTSQLLYDKFNITSAQLGLGQFAILFCWCLKWVLLRWWKSAHGGKKESMYGLQHGRLHLPVSTPMWMNMGYWGYGVEPKSMAEACRDLLKMVLREAGFSSEIERAEIANGTRRPKILIDLGFGCGDQTIYLMSDAPVRPCDKEWWDGREYCPRFEHYIGITKDATQHCYATKRVEEMVGQSKQQNNDTSISLFCGDAATPVAWSQEIKQNLEHALENDPERWLLALDTAYHFVPSRWPLVQYAHTARASFMAFDLCLSPSATLTQKTFLYTLTALMGAPWANFCTPDEYKHKLIAIGYSSHSVKIVDVSEHIFAPLARYLEDQDARLKMLGLGIGSFGVAKQMFKWWGRSGAVRGVIVVARR